MFYKIQEFQCIKRNEFENPIAYVGGSHKMKIQHLNLTIKY